MEIVKLDQTNEQSWNEFCYTNYGLWFFHRKEWLVYLQNSKFGVEFKDHSFFIENNGKIISIVPLIQENDELFSSGFDDRKEVLQEVKRIAVESRVKRIRVDSDIREYLSIDGYTCILSLDQINPSKGHRSCIKKAEKYLTYTLCEDTVRFREDYCRIAGKITRPAITFDLMGKWAAQGFGSLLEAKFDGKTAGYTYLLHWKDRAYYFMSCVETDFREFNVSHFLQSKAFDILRLKGVRYYELGEQVYNSLHCQPTDKEKNISRFKKSFGGQIVLAPASEFYFDRDYFEQVYTKRIKDYKERM